MTSKSISIIGVIATTLGVLATLYAARGTAAEPDTSTVVGSGGNTIGGNNGTLVIGNGNLTGYGNVQVVNSPGASVQNVNAPAGPRLATTATLFDIADLMSVDQSEWPRHVVCEALAATRVRIIEERQVYGVGFANVELIDGAHAGKSGWVASERLMQK